LDEEIEKVLHKIIKEKAEDANKKIPDGFEKFARSRDFKKLLNAMLDYNRVSISIFEFININEYRNFSD